MQNSSYGFGGMFNNRMDNDFYVNGTRFGYHDNDIEQISFHIASDNSYFVEGIIFSLYKLKQQHSHIDFEHTISNGSARSALMLTEVIREKKSNTLMVIIASAAMLNMLSLSIDHRYMDKIVFVATSECNAVVLAQITDASHSSWVIRDKYFPKGTLASLSNREKRICYYLFRGYTPKMIGTILGINVKTVSSHRVSVMKKIGCNNKIEFFKTLKTYYGASVEG
ncbi:MULTISPECIES: helix-turn-helix transcriptional regulator [unclassified Serratia (in: enterobacteria)]|uniref:helix-turn-helix transcriptional regulator n=1 Tax=unclassified Serratia (in: enterobacteria) TaxID=2647522 RepID=UPI0004686BAA|nr:MULTISPECIES: helix-turn-helix transcriptional regulator [unclassified Serratia (in: enterobacteria)]